MRRLRAVALALTLAGLLPASFAARAQDAVAPNDPVLVESMTQLCMRAALSLGGIDKSTKGYCDCVAPIFARHMTPDSRYNLAVQNRFDLRPAYDDDKATFDEVMKICPPKN
jgi:hypothetical protein